MKEPADCRNRAIVGLRIAVMLVSAVVFSTAPFRQSRADVRDWEAPAQERVWLGADQQPLPFRSEDRLLKLLGTAQFKCVVRVLGGVTRAEKVLLEDDGIQIHAVFHDLHVTGTQQVLVDGERVLYFRDSYYNQVAAYELSRLLGLGRVPPTVLREINGKRGSLQFWIENACTEKDRCDNELQPTDPKAIVLAHYDMRVFDNLINNIDRKWQNILYDADWDLWYIDHTRAFGRNVKLRDPKRLVKCSRLLWERLRTLSDDAAYRALRPYMGRMEIKRLLGRRDQIVSFFKEKIEQEGEDRVLFDYIEAK